MSNGDTQILATVTAVDNASANFNKIGASGESLAGKLGKLFAGLAVGALAYKAIGFGKQIIDDLDHLGKMSQKLGISTENLSVLSEVAKESDLSLEGLAGAFRKLSIAQVEALNGSQAAVDLFDELGVSAQKFRGDNFGLLTAIADKFAAMADGAGKAALAVKIFGRSGLDLIPLLNGGGAGIAGIRAELEANGGLHTLEQTKQAELFNDTMTKLHTAIADKVTPAVVKFADWLTRIVQQNNWGDAAASALGIRTDKEIEINKALQEGQWMGFSLLDKWLAGPIAHTLTSKNKDLDYFQSTESGDASMEAIHRVQNALDKQGVAYGIFADALLKYADIAGVKLKDSADVITLLGRANNDPRFADLRHQGALSSEGSDYSRSNPYGRVSGERLVELMMAESARAPNGLKPEEVSRTTFFDGIRNGIADTQKLLDDFYAQGGQASKRFLNGLDSDWDSLFFDVMQRKVTSFGEFFTRFLTSIATQIERLLSKLAADQTTSLFTGLVGGIFGATAADRTPVAGVGPGTGTAGGHELFQASDRISVSGGGGRSGTQMFVNINAHDAQSFAQMAQRSDRDLANIIVAFVSNNPQARNQLRAALS